MAASSWVSNAGSTTRWRRWRALTDGDGAGWHAALDGLDAARDERHLDRMALYDRADQLGAEYASAFG